MNAILPLLFHTSYSKAYNTFKIRFQTFNGQASVHSATLSEEFSFFTTIFVRKAAQWNKMDMESSSLYVCKHMIALRDIQRSLVLYETLLNTVFIRHIISNSYCLL